MGVGELSNTWWSSVLEHGPLSPFASYFDVNWEHPINSRDLGKILVPFLGSHLSDVLKNNELSVLFNQEQGSFSVKYYQLELPLDPITYGQIVSHVKQNILQKSKGVKKEETEEQEEAEKLLEEINSKCVDLDFVKNPQKRVQETENLKKFIRGLVGSLPSPTAALLLLLLLLSLLPYHFLFQKKDIRSLLEEAVSQMNQESTKSTLKKLLEKQNYRPCYWRSSSHELYYSRCLWRKKFLWVCE
jgi:maltooligosyltrehalose synthase